MQQPFSKSQFYMWRAVIAIAHADGDVQNEERAYLTNVIASLDRTYGLEPRQKKTLLDDLDKPQKIEDLVKEIEEPQYRGMLITLGMKLIWADGVVTAEEEAVLDKLHAGQMSTIDAGKLREALREGMKKRRAEDAAQHDKQREEALGNSKLFSAFDKLLSKMGIDILK